MRKIFKVLGLSNSNKIIYELVGNPGSGKTTLLLNYYEKLSKKDLNQKHIYEKINKYEFLKFLIFNPFIIIYTSFWMLIISKSFIHNHLKYNLNSYLMRYLKIYRILLITWFKLKRNKTNFVYIESIMHQISNLDLRKENLINAIVASYGFPKFGIIFIELPIEESMNRQVLRKDNININNPDIIKRYRNSYKIFIELFSYFKYKFLNSKILLRPFSIDGRDNIDLNINKLNKIENFINSKKDDIL